MGELDRMPHREPQAGDIVVGCGHGRAAPVTASAPDLRNPCLWFEATRPISIAHPLLDGNLYARWISVCGSCLLAAGGKASRVTFREHWAYDPAAAAEPARVIR